jgi:hypothetical protein
MTISLIDVRMAPDASENFCDLLIRGDAPLPETCLAVIERPLQEKAFLAVDGWQANYVRLQISVLDEAQDISCLRMSRSLFGFLEAGYNYRISLYGAEGEELGLFVINWYPPAGFLSPARPLRPSKPAEPDLLDPVVVQPMAEVVEEPLSPEPAALPSLPPLPVAPKNPSPRQVMRCPSCGGEVFSTFTACPYCGHPM